MNNPMAAHWLNLARVRRTQGDMPGAVNAYLEADRIAPRDPTVLFELGVTMGAAGLYDQALSVLETALRLGASPTNVLAGKVEILHRLGRYDEALDHYDRLIGEAPGFVAAHYNRGKVLWALGRVEESLAAAERAAALQPDMRDAFVDQGVALHRLRRLPEALASFDRALELDPAASSVHNNRGAALHDAGRFDEALAAFDRAIALQPDNVSAHNNRAFTLLIQGNFAEGWKAMEWRKQAVPPLGVWPGAAPPWSGEEDLRGKTLHVFAEQGLGDILQFCRFFPLLADRGARVVFSCPEGLHPLLSRLDRIELVGVHAGVQADYSLALMSIPGVLGLDLRALGPSPYLDADPERVAAWKARLGEHGFKIGVSWRTSALGEQLGKGFELRALAPIAALPGVRLISLQKGADQELQEARAAMKIETLGEYFDSAGGIFLDTAAVMQGLDLVITADTAIAHLAGALGVPGWVALKHVADWRWMQGRSDTSSYPSLALFRQPEPDNWGEVFSQMRARLIDSGRI